MSESMAAFDRAEFDELLREVVALREWKAAHEAAAFGSVSRCPAPTGTWARANAGAMARHLRVSADHADSPQHAADCRAAADALEYLLDGAERAGAGGGQEPSWRVIRTLRRIAECARWQGAAGHGDYRDIEADATDTLAIIGSRAGTEGSEP